MNTVARRVDRVINGAFDSQRMDNLIHVNLECGHRITLTEREATERPHLRDFQPGGFMLCPTCAERDGEAIAAETPHTD